jgi:hypothetical protein
MIALLASHLLYDADDKGRWVGTRFKSGRLVPEDTVVFASGDLAYTVGFERGEVVVDDGTARLMTIRVTHIYRASTGRGGLSTAMRISLRRTSGKARSSTPGPTRSFGSQLSAPLEASNASDEPQIVAQVSFGGSVERGLCDPVLRRIEAASSFTSGRGRCLRDMGSLCKGEAMKGANPAACDKRLRQLETRS